MPERLHHNTGLKNVESTTLAKDDRMMAASDIAVHNVNLDQPNSQAGNATGDDAHGCPQALDKLMPWSAAYQPDSVRVLAWVSGLLIDMTQPCLNRYFCFRQNWNGRKMQDKPVFSIFCGTAVRLLAGVCVLQNREQGGDTQD